jgi:alkyldihydroxyacetonephosphate synthase
MTAPTPPIAFAGDPSGVHGLGVAPTVPVPEATAARLAAICPISVDPAERAEASRDWWPYAMHLARRDQVIALGAVVCRPRHGREVADVLRICHEQRVPVTTAGGRSGVCGASVPVHGGVVLDITGLAGITAVDDTSLVVDVLAGTFGTDLEDALRGEHRLTLGHWPQSVAISTVGGWLACRSAGQYSTRYGKIEHMVEGLDVVLADGTMFRTGGAPAAAVGSDLTQLFVGSEGTLGVITGARLRVHPVPAAERRAAYGFADFAAGLDACRRVLRRGATPAVLRLYDQAESQRSHGTAGDVAVLLVLDEGELPLVDAVMAIVDEECATAQRLDDALVERWLGHRNDVSALETLTMRGFVVDTMEIAGRWAVLPEVYTSRPRTSPTRTPTERACTSRSRRIRRPRRWAQPTSRSGTPASERCSPLAPTSAITTASG